MSFLYAAILAAVTLGVGYAQQRLYPHERGVPIYWWALSAAGIIGWAALLGSMPSYNLASMGEAFVTAVSSPTDLVAAIFPDVLNGILMLVGIAAAIMTIRQIILAWPLGAALSVVLFIQAYREGEQVEMLLQVFFLITQFYGWAYWMQHSRALSSKRSDGFKSWFDISVYPETSAAARLKHATSFDIGFAVMIVLALANLFGFLFAGNESGAGAHGLLISSAIVAQLLNARKHWFGWAMWAVVNFIGCGVYAAEGDVASTGISLVFLVISLYGLVKWDTLAIQQAKAGLKSEIV